MRSTIDPKSPAFLLNLSGAHERMPLNIPPLTSSRIWLKIGLFPESFAEWLSCLISFTNRPSRTASELISLIWESIDIACLSSPSLDFLAYRQYSIFGICIKGWGVSIGWVLSMVGTRYRKKSGSLVPNFSALRTFFLEIEEKFESM